MPRLDPSSGSVSQRPKIQLAALPAHAPLLSGNDKSRLPSGILYDRVVPLAALPCFDRFRADTSSVDHLRQAYLELYLSAYNQPSFSLTPSQLRERADALARRDLVPLAVLDYR